MNIKIREFKNEDCANMIEIWNEIVEDGVSFPQKEYLSLVSGKRFYKEQTYTGVAEDADTNQILGLYILHPNNLGRCGHICNASFAVKKNKRGSHIGENLVKHCMKKAKEKGFRILQFNAVLKTNEVALYIYNKLGFTKLGVIPNGFQMKDGSFEDIIPHYYEL